MFIKENNALLRSSKTSEQSGVSLLRLLAVFLHLKHALFS